MKISQTQTGKFKINFNNSVVIDLTKQEISKLRHLCYIALDDHVVCRCCGTGNLNWRQVDNKWLLFNKDKLHDCPVKPLQELIQDFDKCDWI